MFCSNITATRAVPVVSSDAGCQVRRAKADPDLSNKLADGLSYLNADEAEEMQQALAMAIYAQSLNSQGEGGYESVKVRCCCCL